MNNEKAKENVAYFMRRLYAQRLTTTSGGNVSFRFGEHIYITPSQTDKSEIQKAEIGLITLSGENLTQDLKLSMESKMHLSVYEARPDIKAIVHAHPIFATSFCASHKKIKTNLAGELWAVVGTPVLANYQLMGTKELANTAAEACLKGNVILLENHGVLAVGENLLQAFDRLEVCEAAAKMTFITELMGKRKELSKSQLQEIDDLFK